MAHLSAYERGREAACRGHDEGANPFPVWSQASDAWRRGWLRESSARKFDRPDASPSGCALVIPHPALTAEQLELICKREGLHIARMGRDRFALVQTSARAPQTMLRIAVPPEAA